MNKMVTDYRCVKCLLQKNINIGSADISDADKTRYVREVLNVIATRSEDLTAPEVVELITELQRKYKVTELDYTETKRRYNSLLLGLEDEISRKIADSTDPLLTAIRYALIGNYIDFGTTLDITEDKLRSLINDVSNVNVDLEELEKLRAELSIAKNVVCITDNCGEVVFDKLLIKLLLEKYKNLKITVLVRGKPVLNDITLEDALQVGLDKITTVIENGTGVAGTVIERINKKSLEALDGADLVISKGMGNFETLVGSGRNIYYLFMCKCEKFCNVFNKPLLTYMFLNEKRIK